MWARYERRLAEAGTDRDAPMPVASGGGCAHHLRHGPVANTHFGFQTVDEREKAARVREVFDTVAPKYDLMNDLMSACLHRAWKAYAVAVADARPGDRVLDIAAGTGDLTRAFARRVGPSGVVMHTDIN